MEQQKALRGIVLAELLIPLLLLLFGIYHGVLQVMYRAGVIRASSFAGIDYYQGLTAHGVINALVLTTFFAVAFGHALVAQELKLPLSTLGAGLSMALMLLGAVMAAAMIFAGKARCSTRFIRRSRRARFFTLASPSLSWVRGSRSIPGSLRTFAGANRIPARKLPWP